MPYVANPKKAEQWSNAIDAATAVFDKIKERTKTEGFTRPIILQIMKPFWPFFHQQLPEDVEDIHAELEEILEYFWEDWEESEADAGKEYGDFDSEMPGTYFASLFRMNLEDTLYDKLIV